MCDWDVLSQRVCAADGMSERNVLRLDGAVVAVWVVHCWVLLQRKCDERDADGWRDGECVSDWCVLSARELNTNSLRQWHLLLANSPC